MEGLLLLGFLRAAVYQLSPVNMYETAKLGEKNQPSTERRALSYTINIKINPAEGTNY